MAGKQPNVIPIYAATTRSSVTMNYSFKFEPALWLGLTRAVLMGVVVFGVNLTPEQQGVILVLAEAVTTLIQRSLVTPNASL